MLHTPIGRLRAIGLLEGSSFLVLLFVAMPLKYLAGRPEAVQVVGWIHGLLFVLFAVAWLQAWLAVRWPLVKAALVFSAALLPFGPFILDRRLRDDERTAPTTQRS